MVEYSGVCLDYLSRLQAAEDQACRQEITASLRYDVFRKAQK